MAMGVPITAERIGQAILFVRGDNVILDADSARLYGVPTRVLVQAVKRNLARFPSDFMFQLNAEEAARLRSQSVISNEKRGRGGRRFLPYAFTEQGVAMLSSVLRIERAIQANIAIMRTFVRLRRMLALRPDLGHKLDALEPITRRGKEVARLVPSEGPRLSNEEFLERAAELRARQPLHRSRSENHIREDRDR